MFKINPSPKQIKKHFVNTEELKPVPEQWEDFTALTTIRSGGEMKPFITYTYQKILIDLSKQYSNIIVLKSRQLGITQAIVSKFLHDACVNPAASSILFMRNAEDASAVSRRARQMLTSIKDYAVADNDNVGYLKIRGGGDIYFKNSGKEGSRSLDSATGMLFDESAFVENIQDIYSASNPSSALSGDRIKKFIVSTPSAKSGWYWDKLNENNGDVNIEELAKDVAAGKTYREFPGCYWFADRVGTLKVILHFTAHPVYSQNPNYLEYRQQQDGTDWETVLREYDLRFVDSAVAVFTSDLVRANAVGEYEETRDKDAVYYAGLDTATTGNDFCTLPIVKYKNGRYSLVHLYRKRHQTSEYHLYQISEILKRYRPRKIGIETTGGVGAVYLEQLSRQLPDLHFEAVKTTSDSKPTMVASLVLALEKEVFNYPGNCPIIEEMLSFRRDGMKLQAAPNKSDDVIMGVCFSLAVSPFAYERQSLIDYNKITPGNIRDFF